MAYQNIVAKYYNSKVKARKFEEGDLFLRKVSQATKDLVKSIADFGVWYSQDTNNVQARYSNVDWAGNADDSKAHQGVVSM